MLWEGNEDWSKQVFNLNLQHVDQVTCFSLRKSQDTLNDDSKHLNLFPASFKNSNAVLNCKSSFYFLRLAIAYKEEIISTDLDQVWLVVVFFFFPSKIVGSVKDCVKCNFQSNKHLTAP